MDGTYKHGVLGLMSLGLLLGTGSALAQDEEKKDESSAETDASITALTEPDSQLDVGFTYVSDDNFHYGQYRGLQDSGLYGAVNLDFAQRDDASGTWLTVDGGMTRLRLRR